MRYAEIVTENQGMLAIKAALYVRRGQEARDQWGILDDLWLTDTGGLMLFRVLRLKQPWQKNLRLNGHTYWSTSRRGAGAYDADALDLRGTVDVMIVAELPGTADVDWQGIWDTIVELHEQGEDEARLDHGVPLIVRRISVEGKDVRSRLIGKTIVT